MTPEQRLNASVDLTLTYFASYYPEWRLTKILANQKLLNERYDFYKDIAKEAGNWDDDSGEATIAQEIKNGLYFDSITHCVQYIEDLFALIRASKKPDYFIRHIITYKAGEVSNAIKAFKADKKTVSKAFHFHDDLVFKEPEQQARYEKGIENLIGLIIDLVTFYNGYYFFCNQYKHGLAVGMRPHGNKFNDEQIALDKKEEFKPYIAVYDNLNLKAGTKKGTVNLKHGIMMPGFTDNVRPFIGELEKSNNFLRFVRPPDYPDFSFETLTDIAYKTRACLHCFIVNYSRKIKPQDEKFFHLPDEYRKNTAVRCSY